MKKMFTPFKGILVALLFMLTSAVSTQTTATMLAFPEGCGGGIGASVDSMSFRISFTNNGTEAVTSVTVVDELPDGLDASGVTLRRGQPATPAVSLSGNTLTFTFSDIELAAGATGTLDYDVPFNPAGLTEGASLNNFATVTLGSEAAVNTDTTTNSFMAAADLPVFEIGNDVVDDDPSNGFESLSFNVMPTGGTPPYSYIWRANGDFITTGSALTLTPLVYLVFDLFVTDANGCVGHDQLFVLPEEVEAPNPIVAGDSCSIAIDINDLFGGEVDEVKTSEVIDLDNYTGGVTNSGITCEGGPVGSAFQSTWLEFTGDGFEYQITTDTAALDNPLNDPLLLLFSGTCGDLTELVCSDDENGTLIPSITVETEIGVVYKLVSGNVLLNPDGQNYRIKITRQGAVNTTEIKHTDINVYPNPTNGLVQLAGVQAEEVAVIDFSGRTVLSRINPGNQLDISALPAGVYTLLITDADQRYSARVIKE